MHCYIFDLMAKGNIIDLFCGAGGFSLGAHLAGFDVCAAVDIDETLTSSYRDNFPKSNLIIADICELGPFTLLLRRAKLKRGDVAGVVGDPLVRGSAQ